MIGAETRSDRQFGSARPVNGSRDNRASISPEFRVLELGGKFVGDKLDRGFLA